MGLLTIIRKNKRKEKEIRGLDNAGKSTIINKFLNKDIDEVSPTIGFQIHTIVHNEYYLFKFDRYKLNIWDVGGQKTIRSFWRNYYDSTDGLIWVIDSSDTSRLEQCKNELIDLLKQELLALDKILSHNWCIFPCSAITGENILNGFDWIVKDISNRLYIY